MALFSPVLLPALQLASHSIRSKYEPIDDVSTAHALLGRPNNPSEALSLHDLTHLLFQSFDGLPVKGGYFFADRSVYIDSAAYVGVIAIVLVVLAIAIRRRNTVVIALAAMTVCLFGLVFVPPVVSAADQLPGVGTFLWNRALLPMVFGLAVLAGFGADAVVRQHSDRRVRRWFGYGFLAAGAVLGALWVFGRGRLPAAEAEVRAHSFIWPAAGVFLGLILAGILWFVHSRAPTALRNRSRNLVGRGIVGALLVFETAFLVSAGFPMWSSGSQFLPTSPPELALKGAVGSSLVGFGKAECSVFPPVLGIRANLNAAYSLHEFSVYDPITPLAYFTSWRAVTGQTGGSRGAEHLLPGGDDGCAGSPVWGELCARTAGRSWSHRRGVRQDDRRRTALPHPRRSARDPESPRRGWDPTECQCPGDSGGCLEPRPGHVEAPHRCDCSVGSPTKADQRSGLARHD